MSDWQRSRPELCGAAMDEGALIILQLGSFPLVLIQGEFPVGTSHILEVRW